MFPFFILPFDHRSSFAKDILETSYPLDEEHSERAKTLKNLIWEAFLLVEERKKTDGTLAVLVDEELGDRVIKAAQKEHIPHIVSVEKSGTDILEFVHEEDFDRALLTRKPTFAKVLVHYVLGDEEKNAPQRLLLKKLVNFCRSADLPLMIEVLTDVKKGEEPPLAQTIIELEEYGIVPTIWKLEGLRDQRAWEGVSQVTDVPIVVLGRGQSEEAVETWIKNAAKSGVVKGFAVGRTIFADPLKELIAGKITESEAKTRIAERFEHFITLWEENSGR